MCLAIPGRVVEASGDGLGRRCTVDYGGVRQEVSLAYLPDAVVGDWVLVHVGIAISKMMPEEAERVREEIRAMGADEAMEGSVGCRA